MTGSWDLCETVIALSNNVLSPATNYAFRSKCTGLKLELHGAL